MDRPSQYLHTKPLIKEVQSNISQKAPNEISYQKAKYLVSKYVCQRKNFALQGLLEKCLHGCTSEDVEQRNLLIFSRVLSKPNILSKLLEWSSKNLKLVTACVYQKGFLRRLELLNSVRIHVFEKEISQVDQFTDESYIHGHKTSFASTILKGGYEHQLYGQADYLEEGRSYQLYAQDQAKYIPIKKVSQLKRKSFDTIDEGNIYFLSYKLMHTLSKIKQGTISLVLRGKLREVNPNFAIVKGSKIANTQQVEQSKSHCLYLISEIQKILYNKKPQSQFHDVNFKKQKLEDKTYYPKHVYCPQSFKYKEKEIKEQYNEQYHAKQQKVFQQKAKRYQSQKKIPQQQNDFRNKKKPQLVYRKKQSELKSYKQNEGISVMNTLETSVDKYIETSCEPGKLNFEVSGESGHDS